MKITDSEEIGTILSTGNKPGSSMEFRQKREKRNTSEGVPSFFEKLPVESTFPFEGIRAT